MVARCDACASFWPEDVGCPSASRSMSPSSLSSANHHGRRRQPRSSATPVLGASLRKAPFRLLGTVIGAIGIVILAAMFRQDRVGFLVGLALWCAVSAFIATLLRNFAAYAAALAGYTAAILASDVLGPVGASDTGSVVILAIDRALEIGIGIVSAGVVLALTDFGRSRRKLAAEFAALSTAIMDGLAECFVNPSASLLQFQALRRDLLRRVIALDPIIDAAIGEASDLRYHSPVLQRAVFGLMETVVAWRWAAFEIARSRDEALSEEAHAIHDQLPRDRASLDALGSRKKPAELREACCSSRALPRSLRCPDAVPSAPGGQRRHRHARHGARAERAHGRGRSKRHDSGQGNGAVCTSPTGCPLPSPPYAFFYRSERYRFSGLRAHGRAARWRSRSARSSSSSCRCRET